MENNFTIYVVDDDPVMRTIFATMLSDRYAIELFATGADCLRRVEEAAPDMFIVDIELTEMGGFDLCRRLKRRPDTSAAPVVFISAHDDLESRLSGYEAGAEEFVVKPFDVADVHHKIETLRRIAQDRSGLARQAESADQLAALVLANLDEYAILIKFLRALNECADSHAVADAMLQVLENYRLEGAVQIRLRTGETTLSKSGENWPLELSVIQHVRKLERIFEFGRRAAYNFDVLTVLVTNMPVDAPEQCGRIRDNIAIAAESADAKLKALQAFDDNARTRAEIGALLAAVREEMAAYERQYNEARYKGSVHTAQFLDDLLAAFAHLGMSEEQEEAVLRLARESANGLADLYDIGGGAQETLRAFGERFAGMLAASGPAPEAVV